MKKLIIALLAAIVAALIILIVHFTGDNNPLKDTKWTGDDGSTLALGKESYEWSLNDNYTKGSYKIHTGRFALSFLKDAEDYKDAVKDDGAFILEEDLKETFSNGKNVEPKSSAYLVTIGTLGKEQTLTLENIKTGDVYSFTEYTEEVTIIPPDEADGENLTGLDYEEPEGYTKYLNESDNVFYKKGDNELEVSVLYAPIDELLEKYPDAEKVGEFYNCSEQEGPTMMYKTFFEKDGITYIISASDDEVLAKLVKSIEA